jgi:hypothetical protein
MLQRFAAASVVGSVIIAVGGLVSLLPPRWAADDALVLTTAWCFVPVAWGVWAIVTPARWVPRRLALWGGILGVIAGIVAGPVLDLPLRLTGFQGTPWIAVLVGPVLYYAAWMLVAVSYRSLSTTAHLRS